MLFNFRALIRELDCDLLNPDESINCSIKTKLDKLQLNFITLDSSYNQRNLKELKMFSFLRCHNYRINSLYYKRIKNKDAHESFKKLYEKDKVFENEFCLKNEIKLTQSSIDETESESLNDFAHLFEEENFIIFKCIFDKFNQIPSNIAEYIQHDNTFTTLFKHIDEMMLKDVQEEDNSGLDAKYEELRLFILARDAEIRKKFLKKVVASKEKEQEIIFFQSNDTNSDIESKFRKYTIFFHPDKVIRKSNKIEGIGFSKDDENLYKSVFQNLCSTKIRLQQNSGKDNSNYKIIIKEAEEKIKFAIDYYYAYKSISTGDSKIMEKLKVLGKKNICEGNANVFKNLAKEYFNAGYEKYKIACKEADINSQFEIMLDCRFKMAATLVLGDMHLEAQLVALASVYMTNNSYLKSHYSPLERKKCRELLSFVKNNQKDELIENFLQSENKKCLSTTSNTQLSTISSKNEIQRLNVNSELIKLNTDNQLNEKLEKNLLIRKTSGFSIVGAIAVIPKIAPILTAINPIFTIVGVCGVFISGCFFINSCIAVKNDKIELNIQAKLKNILKRAEEAYNKDEPVEFLQIISEKYDKVSSIFRIEELDLKYIRTYNIDNLKIVLLEYGFKPDGIAYFLVMFSNIIFDYGNMKNDTTYSYKFLASELLDAVNLNKNDLQNANKIDLEFEAMKLDSKITQIRKNIYKDSKKNKLFLWVKKFMNK